MIFGGFGAHLRHLTVRRIGLHVHLLRARFGIVIETYWRPNGEDFERERNERALPLISRRRARPGSSIEEQENATPSRRDTHLFMTKGRDESGGGSICPLHAVSRM